MEINYMIKSETLLKLKDDISKAVKLIKKSIEEKKPILIRHHCDADGFCAGVVLERAILPLIHETHTREREAWFAYSRKPNMAPYYSYDDANKDLAYFLSEKGNYEYKKPLVILLDNGSSDEDVLALKKLRIYEIDIIVIDHHPISKSVEGLIDVHINPHNLGNDYDFSAGMLCAEISKILNPKTESCAFIAAVSAYADKVKSPEKEEYVKLCLKEGYTEAFLKTCAETLDFEVSSVGYSDSRQLMDDFFGRDKKKQKEIIDMLNEVVLRKKNDALISAKKYSHISRMEKMNLVIIPMGAISFRGEFPHFGKIVGLMHDFVANSEKKPTVSIGLSDSMITFRGTPDSTLDTNKIIKALKQQFPYAQVNGGGHAKAGSVKFIPAAYEEIKEFVLQKIRE
jgi:archaea-specific RecJ-like exonuclease